MNILTTLAQSTYYYNDSSYATQTQLTPDEIAAMSALIFGFMIFTFILSIGMYVVASLCFMRIFKKAGVQAWAAWVPVYNTWKLLEIGGQQGFWAVLSIIPVLNIVAAVYMYIAMYNIGLKLGKSGTFVLLAIFLPIVWIIWLAVDKTPWNDAAGAPSLAGVTPPTAPTPEYQAPTQPTL